MADPWASDAASPAARPVGSDSLPRTRRRAPPDVEQPPPIVRACQLMYVGAALSGIGAVVSALQTDAIRDALEDEHARPDASRDRHRR